MPYIGKAPSSGIRSRFIYTATASQTTFTGADGNGKTLGYTDGEYVDVYLNGVLLDPADYTATSKTSVVLDSGATVSDIVEIVVYDTFSVFNGTFTGDLTVDGDTLFVDASADKVGMGTSSPDADASVLSIKGTDPAQIYDGQIIIHGSATSGAANTGAGIGFKGHHGTGNRNLGAIQCLKENATSGNADAYMRFVTRSNSGGLAEAMRIDSSGNVGIGQSSPSTTLSVRGGSANGIELDEDLDNSTDSNRLFFTTSAGSNSIRSQSGNLVFSTGATAGSSSGTERMRILSGGGLTFNGDTATANALDDYEEGTWTATAGTGTVTSNNTRYVKIGKQVTLFGYLSAFSNRTSSNGVAISGLPFASGSDNTAVGAAFVRYLNVGGDAVSAYIPSGTSTMSFYASRDNDAYVEVRHSHLSSTLSNMFFTITYQV